MNKEFIPFEQSKILKHDLDYSGESLGWYTINKELYFGKDVRPYEDFNFMYPAPTFSQAFRWFESKGYLNYVANNRFGDEVNYWFAITPPQGLTYTDSEGRSTKEEAELACLNRLIEIVKNK